MAREEFDGDYTIALGKLLEYYEIDAKTDMLWRAIEAMEKRIADLEQKEKDKKQDDGDVF
jgi:BMFP domain-containing protein YqiC